jgi:hypothetical protein
MLSKKFFAWVGVGVLSVATIPALAAPQLARLAARKPVPAKTTPVKPAAKPVAKAAVRPVAKAPAATLASHKLAVMKTTAAHAKAPVKLHTLNKKPTTLAHKPVAKNKKAVALAHKPTASATAKKLLH